MTHELVTIVVTTTHVPHVIRDRIQIIDTVATLLLHKPNHEYTHH